MVIKGFDFLLPNYNSILSQLSQICPSLQKRKQFQQSHFYHSDDKSSRHFTSVGSTENPTEFIGVISLFKKMLSQGHCPLRSWNWVNYWVQVLFPELHHG